MLPLLLLLLQINKAFSERRKMMRNTLQPLYTSQQVRRTCLHPLDLSCCTCTASLFATWGHACYT
jgi:16S rRNA A1518/A1519 N6-dimethyltransferase RsmA/KsgA/DIM1 with predicted DNA glycosylase/AP lyase activity